MSACRRAAAQRPPPAVATRHSRGRADRRPDSRARRRTGRHSAADATACGAKARSRCARRPSASNRDEERRHEEPAATHAQPWPVAGIDGAVGPARSRRRVPSPHQAKLGWRLDRSDNPVLARLPAAVVRCAAATGEVYYRFADRVRRRRRIRSAVPADADDRQSCVVIGAVAARSNVTDRPPMTRPAAVASAGRRRG